MVRRWSYINSSNTFNTQTLTSSLNSAFDANINATMYLRRSYPADTLLLRRQWSKRKHLHNWLALSNVLKDWARTYRFYRNYNRFVYNQHFTTSTFLAFNVLKSRSLAPALTRGAEHLIAAVTLRKWVNYFSSSRNARWLALNSFKNILPIMISVTPARSRSHPITQNTSVVPFMGDNVSFLVSDISPSSTSSSSALQLINAALHLPYTMLVATVLSWYRILTKLALLRLN